MAKLLENTFRNVNIAFVNQLALLCERMGLDIWEIVDAAATKPFGFMPFRPGPGVGGHCIPVDPYYLAWRARHFDFTDRFIELAGDINLAMPRHVADLVMEALNEHGRALRGARVGVLGVAFKPNVQDPRNSPSADVIAQLVARGADVRFHDPHIDIFRDASGATHQGHGLDELLGWADVVVVLVNHRAIDWDRVYAEASARRRRGRQRPRARGGRAQRPPPGSRLGAGHAARGRRRRGAWLSEIAPEGEHRAAAPPTAKRRRHRARRGAGTSPSGWRRALRILPAPVPEGRAPGRDRSKDVLRPAVNLARAVRPASA